MQHKFKYFSLFVLIFLFLQIFPQQVIAKIFDNDTVCHSWTDYSGVTYLKYGVTIFGILLIVSLFFFFRKKNILSKILLGMSGVGTIICISLIIFAYKGQASGAGMWRESGFLDSIKVNHSYCDNPTW